MDTKPEYCKLSINAGIPITIWIGDEEGNFVQKGFEVLETSLLPGNYTVEFGLGNPKHIIKLIEDTELCFLSPLIPCRGFLGKKLK